MSNNYTAYHVHSYYSLLDSCTSPKEYVDKAKELGQTALGFSEHGNIFQWYEKMALCNKAGIKYLHGIECYVTEDHNLKHRDNWHTVLIAKNKNGFVEINNLFYKSFQEDHTYYKHRISIDEFLAISDNVIKISACIQSPLWQMHKSIESAEYLDSDRMDKYINLLKHYDYYEIQYHNNEEQIAYNKYLYEMSKIYGKKLIAGTDTHSINKYKAECRVMLQWGKTDGAWGDEENEYDLTYKSYDELVDMFKQQNSLPMDVILEAINNTNVMADSVEEISIDCHNKYPYLYGEDDEKVFWEIINKKYKDKLDKGIITDDPKYLENINEEMAVFKKVNMIGFMLFMSELMSWAKSNSIATGSARGSVAGSTVAYISDITDVDPIKWKTIFSRFCNEHRVEIGDIDTDWYEDDRQKIYDYIIDRFGTEKTGYVLAMGTLAEKSVIDTLGKAFSMKYANSKGLKYKDVQKDTNNKYRLDVIARIKKEYDDNPEATKKKYSDLFYYYDGLAGCVTSQSQHPAGIIASPINLIDFCGAFIGEDGQQILPLDMDACHDTGLVKYDILGLKTVGVIDKTCKLIGKHYPAVHEINFDDQDVYDDMSKDHTSIFQFESKFAGDCLSRMKCKSVFDMSLVNACIRPSGESYRDKLLSRISNKNPSEIIDKLLENNYGWLIYQEDTIAFLQQICGFSGSDADNVRRAIGRKKVDELNAALPKILDGYCSKSDKPKEIAEEEARQFLKVIEDASSYQFGYNHSIAYSIMSYLCGYYRHYYPIEYCTSFLNCAKNDEDIYNGTELIKSLNITMKPIKFGHSGAEYRCDSANREIYKGIASVKNMNEQISEELYNLGQKTYTTFLTLLADIKNHTSVNSRQLDILVKLGFFDQICEINKSLKIIELFDALWGKKQVKKDKLFTLGMPESVARKYAKSETEKQFMFDERQMYLFLNDYCDSLKVTKASVKDIIGWQQEFLGYIDYVDPNANSRLVFVTKLDTKYSPKFIGYSVKSGKTCELRVSKKKKPSEKDKTTFAQIPFQNGDMLMMNKCEKKPKVHMEGEKWVEVPGEFNWWIYNYEKL